MTIFQRMFAAGALLMAFVLPISTQAQATQCGLATSISFPVDTTQFQLVQDFGAADPGSPGRYDTGEDWYGSAGSEVRAIASGQVTYSSPNGWGPDGGVIILRHSFPDGSTAYSMYGGVTDATGIQFPAPFTCVHQGDVLAAIGDPRPAPHLHFEVRTNQPDIPGTGYDTQDPTLDGWRRPSKFVLNWQAWFLSSTIWHADIADEAGPVAPPIELGDHSLLLLDANRVLRLSSDGRVLWRVTLTQPAVGLFQHDSDVLIAYADGKTQGIDADGSLGASNQLNVTLDSAPIQIGSQVIFHTPDNGLVSLIDFGNGVLWQMPDVPPILRWVTNETTLGLMTADNQLLLVSPDGLSIRRAWLREPGSLAVAPNDDLLAYTRGGLWDITLTGTGDWSLQVPDAPPGGRSSAVAEDAQHLFLFDGATLHAYDANHMPQWSTPLPGVSGTVSLSIYKGGGVVLLTSSGGNIIALQASSGGVCNTTRLYGSNRSREWHSLGDDGVLRVYVADQIIGLNWQKFLMACA